MPPHKDITNNISELSSLTEGSQYVPEQRDHFVVPVGLLEEDCCH